MRLLSVNLAGAVAALLGVCSAAWQAELPSQKLNVTLAICALLSLLWAVLSANRQRAALAQMLCFALLGYLYTSYVADSSMRLRNAVPIAAQSQQRDACIVDFPKASASSDARAPLRLLLALAPEQDASAGIASVSWYGPKQKPRAGECWRLKLKLRRVHGNANPAGFDFERFAAARNISYVGYVEDHRDNHLLRPAQGLLSLRDQISQQFATSLDAQNATSNAKQRALALAQALAVADTRGISDADWELYRHTGVTHLIAISGLHITLLAALGALAAKQLSWLWPGLNRWLPRPQLCAAAALLSAGAYAALAGFGVPAQRTLLTLAAMLAGVLLRQRIGLWQSYSLALLGVLALDPLAVLSPGFWLSFAAVAMLLLAFGARWPARGFWAALLPAQLLMSLGLLPLGLLLFQQLAPLSPLINLAAVPLITLLAVPLLLVCVLLALIAPTLASPLMELSITLLAKLLTGLDFLASIGADWQFANASWSAPSLLVFALAMLGLLWLFAPRHTPARWAAPLLLLPLFFPNRPTMLEQGQFRLTLLDVGQGLSAVVQTARHTLLYDAGPGWPEGANAGESQIMPSLHAMSIRRLDRVVLSHADSDHAGGLAPVAQAFPEAELYTSAIGKKANFDSLLSIKACELGQRWEWDGVHFAMLHPNAGLPYLRNFSSCVLHISSKREGRYQSALLPGDIDVLMEARILRNAPNQLAANVLIAAHHGSAGSNSAAFLDAVSPEQVWYPVGHQNRFNFPRDEARRRAQAVGAVEQSTAQSGALQLTFGANDARVQQVRADRYWWRNR